MMFCMMIIFRSFYTFHRRPSTNSKSKIKNRSEKIQLEYKLSLTLTVNGLVSGVVTRCVIVVIGLVTRCILIGLATRCVDAGT